MEIVLAGLVRDCERHIKADFIRFEKSFSMFSKRYYILVESDSADCTLSLINELKNLYDIKLITLGNLRQSHPIRTDRLAICRNTYLDEINTNPKYENCKYVAVADFDGINSGLTYRSVQSSFQHIERWDACFANQRGVYYDIYALRHHIWNAGDSNEQKTFYEAAGLKRADAIRNAIYNKMITINSQAKPIEVDSAFGGLGIYKKELFLAGRYDGFNEKNAEICEHVMFHAAMKKRGARLLIMPSMINGTWNEHSLLKFFSYRIFVKIKRFMKNLSLL